MQSPQNLRGRPDWKRRAPAISRRCLCFFFTTPLCYGVWGHGVWCNIPFLEKNLDPTVVDPNLKALSLLIFWTFNWKWVSTMAMKALKRSKALLLATIKWVQVAHRKLSIMVKKYLEPLYVGEWCGPQVSMCINWKGFMFSILLSQKGNLVCLASGHIAQEKNCLEDKCESRMEMYFILEKRICPIL